MTRIIRFSAISLALSLIHILPSASSASNEAAFGYNTEIEANLTTWTWDTGGVDLEMSVIQKKYPGINMEYTVDVYKRQG